MARLCKIKELKNILKQENPFMYVVSNKIDPYYSRITKKLRMEVVDASKRNKLISRIKGGIAHHIIQNIDLWSLLDWDINALIDRLDETFPEGLNWENMDEWHIDHIIPKSNFKFTKFTDESFKKCWSLSNLRVLSKKDNLERNKNRGSTKN